MLGDGDEVEGEENEDGGEIVVDDEVPQAPVLKPRSDGATKQAADGGKPPAAANDEAGDVEEEAGEGKGAEAEAEAEPDDPIDQLLDPAKRPVWVKELLQRAGEEAADLPVSAEELAELPIEAQRTVVNLLRRAEQAQAALRSAEQKNLDDRKKVAAEARQVARVRAEQLSWAEHPVTKAFLEKLKPAENEDRLDPESPEGRRAAVRAEARELFGAFFTTIQEADKALKASQTATEQQEAQASRKEAIGAYMRQHEADFTDPTMLGRIKALLQEFTPPGAKGSMITVERAHQLARLEFATQDDPDVPTKALEKARARVQRGGGGGKLRLPATPKFRDSHEESEFYAANPDAVQRDLERAVREGLLV